MNQSFKESVQEHIDWLNETICCDRPIGDREAIRKDMLDKVNGDYYEVVVVLHLNNGDKIELRNHSLECYINRRNVHSDFIDLYGESANERDNVYGVHWNEHDEEGWHFHQAFVPLSSICWVDGYSEDIDWEKDMEKILDEAIEYDRRLERRRLENNV